MRRIGIGLLLVVAAALAINTVVTDRETKDAEAELGRVVDLPGGDLHVREDGSRDDPALVMLHGFAASMHWWTPLTERLAGDFHIVRIDELGHGRSEKPRDGYSMENQARLADLALERLGVRRATVVGHSMGGTVATALAERNPDLVERLVVIASPPDPDAGELPFTARLGFVPVLGEAIRRVVPDGVVRDNLGSAFAEGFEVPDRFVDDFRDMTYTSYDESHHASDDYGDEKSLAERLADVGKPLLVIFGAEDEIVDPDSAERYGRVPRARIVKLSGSGHSPMLERPDETARLVRAFGRERRRAGASR